MNKWEELKSVVAQAELEAEKFYSRGNKAAGTRLRGLMQTVKNQAQEVRKEILETKSTEK